MVGCVWCTVDISFSCSEQWARCFNHWVRSIVRVARNAGPLARLTRTALGVQNDHYKNAPRVPFDSWSLAAFMWTLFWNKWDSTGADLTESSEFLQTRGHFERAQFAQGETHCTLL